MIYRIYLAIPFLDELKQICDWVASPVTALSLFMWFKVEDCMLSLRTIQTEMDGRASLPLNRKDRQCIGITALVGLIAIVTGPLVFFSGLNVLRESNLIVPFATSESAPTSTSFQIFLRIPGTPVSRLSLISSNQAMTKSLPLESVRDDEILAPLVTLESVDLQQISFPNSSDTDWSLSPPMREGIIKLLSEGHQVFLVAQWTFAREHSVFPTSLISQRAVNATEFLEIMRSPSGGVIDVSGLIPHAAYLDATSAAKIINTDRSDSIPVRLGRVLDNDGTEWWNLLHGKGLTCLVERSISSGSTGAGGGLYSLSVVGMYLGVVLTIGRFLRLSLQGSSKRIETEELPSTETLMQICQGIQIARLFKNTKIEKKLYYDLVRMFRDPQLLIAATGTDVAGNNRD